MLADSGTSTLSWSSTGATSCTRGGDAVATSGSVTVGPAAAGSHSYTVSCTGAGGSGSDSATLTAVPPPTVSVGANPTSVTAGENTVELTWSSTNARSCAYGGTTLATGGTRTVGPFAAGPHTLTVSCAGTVAGASASDSVGITAVAAPAVTASLNPATVAEHVGETDLTWSSTGATACSLDGGSALQTSGTLTGLGPFHAGSYSFTVNCENSAGFTSSRTVTVTARASSTALCSSESAAPANASSLSLGNHTFSVTGGTAGSVWGTDTYTADSDIAAAAVHAGHVASGDTAIVTLTRTAGQSSYAGSTRNGVTSSSHASATGSYTLSLVGACKEDPPNAPENLTATPNPSTDGNLALSWDTPASGTTPTGYLVYRQDSADGLLTKPFTDRTLSISGLDTGSYTYKAYACSGTAGNPDCGPAASVTVTVAVADTDGDGILDNLDTDDDNDGMPDACEKKYGFNPRDASDGGTTNTDGDGASNVHECLHGTDPTATPANTVLPDTDRDGMYDAWESNNRLDPDDADDASLDDDGDGYTNLEEFTARTDPQWDQSHPKSIPELQFGFNDSYTVAVGTINSEDILQDILVRNPTAGILPSVSDFVLIQKRGGGFDLKDADDYTITASTLTNISSKATVVDINGDGVKDLILTGLNSGTAAITGADDQVVYGSYYERYAIPEKHIALTATRKKFFSDLSAWIDNAKYFETNVSVSTTLDIDEAENSDEDEVGGTAASSSFRNFGQTAPNDDFYRDNARKCVGLSPVHCFIIGTNGLWGLLDPIIYNQIRISAQGKKIIFAAPGGNSNHPTTVNVYDTSGFDQEARMLALYYLAPIRNSGSLQPGSTGAKTVADMLEVVLDTPIFGNLLYDAGIGVVAEVEDHFSYKETINHILNTVGYLRDNVQLERLAAPQSSQTSGSKRISQLPESLLLKEKSPNWDVLEGLPDCNDLNLSCSLDDFSAEQRNDINARIVQLIGRLKGTTYRTLDAAAIAIHDSRLHDFAIEVGVEFYATIVPVAGGFVIDKAGTAFNEYEVTYEFPPLGAIVWHNHPPNHGVNPLDAALTARRNLQQICNDGDDFSFYTSYYDKLHNVHVLAKANVKQMTEITDLENSVLPYQIYRNATWSGANSYPSGKVSEELINSITCPQN